MLGYYCGFLVKSEPVFAKHLLRSVVAEITLAGHDGRPHESAHNQGIIEPLNGAGE